MNKIRLFFDGFVEGFKEFGHKVSNIRNFLVLLIVYFLGVGLISIVAKAFGKHFLDLNIKNTKSYWIDKEITKEPIENYYRQF